MPPYDQIFRRYRQHCEAYWLAGHSDNERGQMAARIALEEMQFFLVPNTFTNAAFERSEIDRQGEIHNLEKKVEQASGSVLTNEARLHKLRTKQV